MLIDLIATPDSRSIPQYRLDDIGGELKSDEHREAVRAIFKTAFETLSGVKVTIRFSDED